MHHRNERILTSSLAKKIQRSVVFFIYLKIIHQCELGRNTHYYNSFTSLWYNLNLKRSIIIYSLHYKLPCPLYFLVFKCPETFSGRPWYNTCNTKRGLYSGVLIVFKWIGFSTVSTV